MVADYSNYLGYIKYEGASVAEGLLDARKAGEALMGFDEALRFFLLEQGIEGVDFDIPVRVRKGSWETLIPQTFGDWVVTSGGVVTTTVRND